MTKETKQNIIYKYCIIGTCLLAFFQQYMLIQFSTLANTYNTQNPENSIPIHPFTDIQIMIYALLIIAQLKSLNNYVFHNFALQQVSKDPNCEDPHNLADRFQHFQFSWVWYIFSLSFAIYNFYNHPNIWKLIGGNCPLQTHCPLLNWPNHEPFPYLSYYYMTNMARHFYSLIYHVIFARYVGNYLEMSQHHTLTVLLILFSYFTGQHATGVNVLICHDIGDFILSFAKWSRDMILPVKSGIFILSMYIILIIGFFYSRIYAPAMTYLKCWVPYLFITANRKYCEGFTAETEDIIQKLKIHIGNRVLVGFLLALWVLNLVWLFIMLKIGYNKLTRKQAGFVSDYENSRDQTNQGKKNK